MAVAKVIELISEGLTVEDAVQNAVTQASKSIRNIQGVYVEGTKALVTDNKVTSYRVNCKITFVVD